MSLLGTIDAGMTVRVKQHPRSAPEDWEGKEVTVTDVGDLIVGCVRVALGASLDPAVWGSTYTTGVQLTDLEAVK